LGCHLRESFVLKVEIEESVARRASFQTFAQALPQKGGFATAAHADDSHRLAFDACETDITAFKAAAFKNHSVDASGSDQQFQLRRAEINSGSPLLGPATKSSWWKSVWTWPIPSEFRWQPTPSLLARPISVICGGRILPPASTAFAHRK